MTLAFDLLTTKSNQHIYKPKYICDQNWVKFPSPSFLRYGVHNVFETDRLAHSHTHSLTDRQTRLQNTSSTVFNSDGGTTITNSFESQQSSQMSQKSNHFQEAPLHIFLYRVTSISDIISSVIAWPYRRARGRRHKQYHASPIF